MSGYPIKWVPIGDEEREEKLRVFKEADSKEVDMMMSVPAGVRMPSNFVKGNWAERIYNFNLRPDDIWIVTFPKCGTTVRVRELLPHEYKVFISSRTLVYLTLILAVPLQARFCLGRGRSYKMCR